MKTRRWVVIDFISVVIAKCVKSKRLTVWRGVVVLLVYSSMLLIYSGVGSIHILNWSLNTN